MDSVIYTPRLKLTLVAKAERGSEELEWLHEMRSNKEAMHWSISGGSKTLEDTEKFVGFCLPNKKEEKNQYRVPYAVHEILEPTGDSAPVETKDKPTKFIGMVSLFPLDTRSLPLPENLSPPGDPSTLNMEVAYSFLPSAWKKGFATESVAALFELCKRSPEFWAPYKKLYVRALVNKENPPSMRVMEKTRMNLNGIYHWKGDAIFIGGRWREEDDLCIYGTHLME